MLTLLSAPTIWPKTAPDIFSANVNRNLFRPLTAVKSTEIAKSRRGETDLIPRPVQDVQPLRSVQIVQDFTRYLVNSTEEILRSYLTSQRCARSKRESSGIKNSQGSEHRLVRPAAENGCAQQDCALTLNTWCDGLKSEMQHTNTSLAAMPAVTRAIRRCFRNIAARADLPTSRGVSRWQDTVIRWSWLGRRFGKWYF